MKYFLCRLIPPRTTFAQNMTAAEAKVMAEHAAYWHELSGKGKAIIFGPVADPKGVWGVVILEVEDEAEGQYLTAHDPAITAKIGARFEILPMPKIVIGKKR